MAQRVTQDPDLALGEGTPNQIVTQVPDMALAEGTPNQRVTQVVTLTLIDANVLTPIIFAVT